MNILRRLRGAPPTSRRPRRARPQLECLEEREVPAVATPAIYQNPFLATNNYGGIHFNAYQTDTTSVPGAASAPGQRTETKLIGDVPFGIAATLTFDSLGRIITIYGGSSFSGGSLSLQRELLLIDPVTLATLDKVDLPGGASGGGTVFGGGGYFYLDNLGRAVVPTTSQQVRLYGVNGSNKFQLDATYDLSGAIANSGDTVTSVLADSAGNIWFATEAGKVGYVNPTTSAVQVINTGEPISKSLASDENGGVYVVSDYALYRFQAGAGGAVTTVWRSAYDRGTREKPGQVQQGSGTTPTCFNDFAGNQFVAICDNADPYMHVNVYNRTTGALVAQQAVFGAFTGDTENSLICVNHSIVVENNYGFSSPVDVLGPLTLVGGVDRVDFDPATGASSVAWTNPACVPSIVSQLSSADGQVYSYIKKDTGWYFAAINFQTGATTALSKAPLSDVAGGLLADNYYSGIGIGPDGSVYAGVFGGLNVWRPVTLPLYATGAGAGGGPQVNVYDAITVATKTSFYAFPYGFSGGVRVALGDVNGDGVKDVIAAAGPGAGPQVNVYDGKTGQLLASFYAWPTSFTGGLYVAAGDVNGDGFADVVVGADEGGGPEVKVFSGVDFSLIRDFYALPQSFTGGVRVAAGDVNGDGFADIIVGAGPGAGPQVSVFSGVDLTVLRTFYAFPASFTGGVYVAAGDVNQDGFAEVIVGAGAGGGPQVTVFDGQKGTATESFYAFATGFTGGARVGFAPALGAGFRPAILAAAGPGGGPEVATFDSVTLQSLGAFFTYDQKFTGGVFVVG